MKRISTFLSIKTMVFNKATPDAGRQDELEALVRARPNITDEEACYAMYGNRTKGSGYRTVKHRLNQRLMGQMLLVAADSSHKRRYNYRILYALSQITIGIVLFKYFHRPIAIPYVEKAYAVAQTNDFLEIASLAQQILQNHYGYIATDKERMECLIKEGYDLVNLLKVEKQVKEYNTRMSHLHVTRKGAYSADEMAFLLAAKNDLEHIVEEYATWTIHFFGYDLIFYYYQTIKDYDKCLEVSLKGLEVVRTLYPEDRKFQYRMHINLATASFYLGDSDASIQYYRTMLRMLTPGTRRWFIDSADLFALLICAKRYDELFELYQEVTSFKSLRKNTLEREEWRLREAYLNFLIKVGEITPKETFPKFRLYRFLNSFMEGEKDKKGTNVTIQIVKILFLLLDEKYSEVTDLTEGLTQYTKRYLKNDESFRSSCFVKMLLKAAKVQFNPIRTRRDTHKLYERLIASQLMLDNRGDYAELIPYEELWESVLLCSDRLKSK